MTLRGAASRDLQPVCCCLKVLGGKDRPHCHGGEAALRTTQFLDLGKQGHLPWEILQEVKHPGAQFPLELPGSLCLFLVGNTNPSSPSLSQAPPELPQLGQTQPLNTSQQGSVQGFQKSQAQNNSTLMQAADKGKEKQRSRNPSS